MAERVTGKGKKKAGRSPARSVGPRLASSPSSDRLGELEAECARLKAELIEAGAHIKALEVQRKQLLDRIDWAIDSLHTLIEE